MPVAGSVRASWAFCGPRGLIEGADIPQIPAPSQKGEKGPVLCLGGLWHLMCRDQDPQQLQPLPDLPLSCIGDALTYSMQVFQQQYRQPPGFPGAVGGQAGVRGARLVFGGECGQPGGGRPGLRDGGSCTNKGLGACLVAPWAPPGTSRMREATPREVRLLLILRSLLSGGKNWTVQAR